MVIGTNTKLSGMKYDDSLFKKKEKLLLMKVFSVFRKMVSVTNISDFFVVCGQVQLNK